MKKKEIIQLDSLLKYSQQIVNTIPGTEAHILIDKQSLELKIVDEGRLCKYFNTSPKDIKEHLSIYEIDLRGTSENINIIKDQLKHFFPEYTTFDKIGLFDKIDIIAVAAPEFNTTARKDFIITINHGLAKHIDLIALCSFMLQNFDEIIEEGEESEGFSLLQVIGSLVYFLVNYRLNDAQALSNSMIFWKSYQKLKNGKYPNIDTIITTHKMRLLFFLIAHEYGHILLFHNIVKSFFNNDMPPWVDATFFKEYEADLYASWALLNFCKQNNQNEIGIGVQLSLTMGLLSLPNSKKIDFSKLPTENDIRGYPNAYVRAILIMEHFFPKWMHSENGLDINSFFLTLEPLQNACKDIFSSKTTS